MSPRPRHEYVGVLFVRYKHAGRNPKGCSGCPQRLDRGSGFLSGIFSIKLKREQRKEEQKTKRTRRNHYPTFKAKLGGLPPRGAEA